MSFKYGSNARPFDINVALATQEYGNYNLTEHSPSDENVPKYYTIEFKQELPDTLYKSLELIPLSKLEDYGSKEYTNEFYDKITTTIHPKFMYVDLIMYVKNEDGELEYIDSEKVSINSFIEKVEKG